MILLAFYRYPVILQKYRKSSQDITFYLEQGYIVRPFGLAGIREYWPITCFKCKESSYISRSPIGKRGMPCDKCLAKWKAGIEGKEIEEEEEMEEHEKIATIIPTDLPKNITSINVKRLFGKIDWYDVDKGFGVINGSDYRTYFVHHSNLNFSDAQLSHGEELTFLTKKRERKEGFEAYNVNLKHIDSEELHEELYFPENSFERPFFLLLSSIQSSHLCSNLKHRSQFVGYFLKVRI